MVISTYDVQSIAPMSPYFVGRIGRSSAAMAILLAAAEELPRKTGLHGGVSRPRILAEGPGVKGKIKGDGR